MDWVQALLPVFKNFSSTMVVPSNLRSYNRRDCYERFKSIGLNYGTVFQGIHTLVQTGDREGFALMDFSQIDNSEEKFSLHPGVLDACFQVLLGVIKSLATAYVPVHIKKISWKASMPDTLPANKQVAVFARAVADSEDATSIMGDIVVMDRECTEVLGRVLEMKAAALSNANANDASQVQRNYATSWQSWKLPALDASVVPTSLSLQGVPAPVADLVKADHDVLDIACKFYIANALKALPATYDVKTQPLHRQRYLEWCKQTVEGFVPAETVSLEAARATLGVEAEAIQRVGENMVQLLKDPLSAQKILFSDDLMDRLYKTSTSFAPYVDALVHVFGQLLQHQSALNKRVLRIVEVGAGTGGLTERLIQEIVRVLGGGKNTPPAVRYMFTDISQKFLNDARKKFQEHSWIDYRLLNLETSPSEQAIPAHSIDIVLAFDVLHVASDIDSCLKNVREMLSPGGLLLAIEPTKPPVWMDMYFGLFKEWLNFSDSTRLERGKCTMPVSVWNTVLQKNEFNCLKTLVSEPEFVHGLLIAQSGLSDAAVAASAAVVAADKPAKNLTVFVDGSVEELLATVKRVMTNDANADKIVVVVTRDCQPVGEVARTGLNLADSQRIGFARVVASEYPEADIRIVDVPSSFSAEKVNEWVQRIVAMSQANVLLDREIAIRGDDIFVPRLRLLSEEPAVVKPVTASSREEHFRLDIGTRGQLSTLFWAETRIPTSGLAPNDVVVDVHAAAMNFKDLMIALGMITVPTKNKRFVINLGLEFSGKVVAVGSSVSHVAVGQEVFGVGSNCFGSRVLTSGDLVVAKPKHLTHVEAASLPIVFATCYSALMAKARIEKDEVVLVHSAAGGIGQAAIQLCKKTGSEVIATVSSEEKRQFLREKYGVCKFTDSRDVGIWSSEVSTMTASRGGVDVVLNSLKGKAIPAGLQCLSLGGRFVEIGKVDILRNSKIGMGHLLRDISLHSVQLDIVMDEQQHVMKRYLAAVSQLAEAKDIQPIVDLVVPAAKIESAFRYMMAGKHKGKIVVDFASADSKDKQALLASEGIPLRRKLFDADCCYVISGGLGALGWETVKWMVREEGATRFLLLSRSGKLSEAQKVELAALQAELGASQLKVHVAACDIAERSQVEAAFKEAAAKRVLQGKVAIYHMAMILRDARLTNMTPEMLREAISCKVDGASFLLEFAQQEGRHLDFVLLFSSISSTFGNPDQANYAAGNSYLDALGATLAVQMPNTKVGVINLSGVEDVGVLAEDFRLRQMSRLRGLQAGLTVRRVLEQVRTMLTRNDESVQWVFGNFAFKPLVETFPMLRAKCDHLVDYRIAVVNDDGAGKTVVSIETVTAAVARLFAVDAKTIEAQAPLTQLGLDSLLAVELSSTLKKNFDVKFTQMELLGGVSIEKIVARATGAK
jgi:NADPH:quinone reductase-like Zn-dependent oxidoreductase/SAM-dependent methyltransferase/acyl carrier protein/short-subunit dehydrogenase